MVETPTVQNTWETSEIDLKMVSEMYKKITGAFFNLNHSVL